MEENYPEINNEEISRINEGPRETDPFDGGVTAPLAGDDADSKAAFYSLSDSDIRVLQKSVDRKAIDYIDRAEHDGRITSEAADYLRSYYADSMEIYAQFYYEMISVLGEPQTCRRNDLEPGEVDDKNYSLTYVTPNNSMILTYPNISDDIDLAESKMYFTMPGMKNVARAVAKIQKGGKYDEAYREELAALARQHPRGGKTYQRSVAALTPVHERLKDVLRATISVPTYDSIEKIISKITRASGFKVAETKDKFRANRSASDNSFYENKKNYRDKKICFKKDGLYFEIQFKVQLLEKADSLSHPLYEKLREKIDEFTRSDQSDFDARNRLEREKTWLEWEIRKINRKGIDDYNLFILDKALKKDTRLKKEKIRRLRLEYAQTSDAEERRRLQKEIYQTGQSLNAAPVTPEAENFIRNNFIVRPYKAIDQQREFTDAPPELQSFAMLNYFLVSPRYRATIPGRLSDEYNDKYNQADSARRRNEQDVFEQECRLYEQTRGKSGILFNRKNYHRG